MRSLALLPVLLLAAVAWAADPDMQRAQDAGLRYSVPKPWTRVPAPSDMRAAQYRIEGDAADPKDDAEAVLFFFGAGQGGGAQANLDRWYSQFQQPDGRPSRDVAKVTPRTVNGLSVTAIDLAGTYQPGPMMGGTGEPRPDTRMLAAVIEGKGGPWFFRIIGPEPAMRSVAADFDRLLGSLEPHQ
jgi:hypothetical protein